MRLLRHRDRSIVELGRELAARGVGEEARQEALATLSRTGLVDDARFAGARARSLAGRGAGDALIRHELAAAGVGGEVIDDALAALAPEGDRAREVVARRGASPKTARYLLGKGFPDEVVREVVARAGEEALG